MLSQIEKTEYYLRQLPKFALWVYPLVAHIAILQDQFILPVYYLAGVVCMNSLLWILQYRTVVAVLSASVFMLFLCVSFYPVFNFSFNFSLHPSIIYLPPILIPSWLAFVFLSSLKYEKALISTIAERMEGRALDARHLRYTRRLTALWGMAFLLMTGEGIVLAKWASFESWSWWVHIGNYFLVALLFIIEMSLRPYFTGKRVQLAKMFGLLLRRNWHDR